MEAMLQPFSLPIKGRECQLEHNELGPYRLGRHLEARPDTIHGASST